MTRDYRDVVIETLAASECDLATRCAALREILHGALDALHERDVEIARLRDAHYRLIDEYRRCRATTTDMRRVA